MTTTKAIGKDQRFLAQQFWCFCTYVPKEYTYVKGMNTYKSFQKGGEKEGIFVCGKEMEFYNLTNNPKNDNIK